MSALPTLFLSHGSPMLALQDSPARRFLQGLGQSLGARRPSSWCRRTGKPVAPRP
jgi:aromatic ring-opening dioxygenase catalytic subunit (LigB family)